MKQTGTKPTLGLRVEGDQLHPQLIQVDSTFQKCPLAHAAGIPLYVKRLFNEPRIQSDNYIIVRMMSQPSVGLAPINWQYGGCLQAAPTVLMARNDSIQFNLHDWAILDEFQIAMLDDGPRKVQRKDFISFAKNQLDEAILNEAIFIEAGYKLNIYNIMLEALFTKGKQVKVNGIVSNQELNGKIGICNGIYLNDRLGVYVTELKKQFAIRPKHLKNV